MKFPCWRYPAVFCGAAAVIAGPAHAERVETYWLLSSSDATFQGRSAPGSVIFEQRLLPVRLAQLTQATTVNGHTLPAGSFLYMVFNHAGKIGYCTIKDRSLGNQVRTLFLPVLDKRPCLVDSDADGRFDKVFSVFDKYGGPPSVRGSIDEATTVANTIDYKIVDRSLFPVDIRMQFRFTGSKKKISHTRVAISFVGPVKGEWREVYGKDTPQGTLFDMGNVKINLSYISPSYAEYNGVYTPGMYASSNNRNALFVTTLPGYVDE